jgi:polar amino acid transport system substrate-binding protein
MRFAGIMALTVVLLVEATWAQDATAPARTALAPTGTLRVALLTLPHMAVRDLSTGQYKGVNADLGRELARRLGVTAEFIAVGSNVAAVDEIKGGRADVTFLVALPELTTQIDFGPAYIAYETTFLVPQRSSIRSFADLNHAGLRVVAPEPSAIATEIGRRFKTVSLIGVPIATTSARRVADMLRNGEADAYSNLTHLLSLAQAELPDWRLLPGSYMTPVFSMGFAKDRPAGADYANRFIEDVKRDGFIEKAITRANLKGAAVAK